LSVLEIVRLTNGDIALIEPDSNEEPLVLVRFSKRIQDMLGEDSVAIAEAMIEAATDLMDVSYEDDVELVPGAVVH